MSRIGKLPIKIPQEVKCEIIRDQIEVSGPKGELARSLPASLEVKVNDDMINVLLKDKKSFNLWGTYRTILSNMIVGVTSGFSKELEIVGIGFKANKEGDNLVLNLGFSHPVVINPPYGINFEVVKNQVTISGIDKEKVGQVAAHIRALKKPEPYKGKGIKYKGESIRRKAGKSAKAVGALAK